MHGRAAAGIVAVILAWGAAAHAQPGGASRPPAPTTLRPPGTWAPEPAPPPRTRTVRYGATIAAVDGLSAALVVFGAAFVISEAFDGGGDGDEGGVGVLMMVGGVAGYALGGPIVHVRKGNNNGAWKSVALRLGLPLAGTLVGSAMDSSDTSGDEYSSNDDSAGSMAALGLVAAMVIDWAVVAKVQVTEPAPGGYVPYAAPLASGGVSFGIAGGF